MKDFIKVFFEAYILPLNKKIRNGELTFLDLNFDNNKESYFTSPAHPLYLYLSHISLENIEQLEAFLKDFWKNEPELLTMVPDLAKLAFKLKEENKEQSAELSPFVYTMF